MLKVGKGEIISGNPEKILK